MTFTTIASAALIIVVGFLFSFNHWRTIRIGSGFGFAMEGASSSIEDA